MAAAFVVGLAVGSPIGAAVGLEVVGFAVGWEVGAAVGLEVGDTVGWAVGAAVGDGVGIMMHSVTPSSASAVHWPDGQCRHSVLADPSANLPAAQSLHSPPVLAWYWPGAQSVHAVAGATAYVPLGHAVQLIAL